MTYQGLRVSALWNINDDWNALVTQSYQNIDAEGVFYQMPTSSDGEPLPPQSVTLFNNSFNKDQFREHRAGPSTGRFGALKAVYTGAYLVRNDRADPGLHQLRARRVRGLLPVPWRASPPNGSGRDLLLAEQHLERNSSATPTRATSSA